MLHETKKQIRSLNIIVLILSKTKKKRSRKETSFIQKKIQNFQNQHWLTVIFKTILLL